MPIMAIPNGKFRLHDSQVRLKCCLTIQAANILHALTMEECGFRDLVQAGWKSWRHAHLLSQGTNHSRTN